MKSELLKKIFLLIKEISLFVYPIIFAHQSRENRPFSRPFYFRADQVRKNNWRTKIKGIKVCTCLPCIDQDFKNWQAISTDTFRTSPETVRFHWFTYKRKKGDEDSDSDRDATLDDDDLANSNGVISETVSSLPQVGDIAVIKADDPVFFLYLIKVTQEETIL